MRIGAIVLAVLFGLLGVRSAVRWSSVRFEAETSLDHLLYSIHVAARTCVWFALAGVFVGFAVLDEPERFRWFIMVPIGLGAVQLLSALALWRSPRRDRHGQTHPTTGSSLDGKGSDMEHVSRPTGPLEPEKHGESSDSGRPQPEASEVESARILANQARADLRQAGLSDSQIRRLADEYIALDLGEDLDGFVAWARRRPATPPAP
jgi:hypothetical protein